MGSTHLVSQSVAHPVPWPCAPFPFALLLRVADSAPHGVSFVVH